MERIVVSAIAHGIKLTGNKIKDGATWVGNKIGDAWGSIINKISGKKASDKLASGSITIEEELEEIAKLTSKISGKKESDNGAEKTYGEGVYPKDPSELVEQGWKDVTNPRDKSGNKTYQNPKTGEKVRYDETSNGKGHYQRYNPNSTGRNDRYLDKNGNPVRDGSKPSHIYPN